MTTQVCINHVPLESVEINLDYHSVNSVQNAHLVMLRRQHQLVLVRNVLQVLRALQVQEDASFAHLISIITTKVQIPVWDVQVI